MISKNKIKQIKSLASKKGRQKELLFLAEGDKIILELLQSKRYRVNELYATESFLEAGKNLIKGAAKVYPADCNEIKKASLLKNPQNAFALCNIPPDQNSVPHLPGLSLFLDEVQDPGNLGTIMRICDWFGIEQLFCSPGTADIYNPKVIQASMGSFCRVEVRYISFNDLFKIAGENEIPVVGAFTNGKNIYTGQLPGKALVVLGNEGKGIGQETAVNIEYRLTIPSFGNSPAKAESLNVAVAAGIICSEFKRQASNMYPIRNESRG